MGRQPPLWWSGYRRRKAAGIQLQNAPVQNGNGSGPVQIVAPQLPQTIAVAAPTYNASVQAAFASAQVHAQSASYSGPTVLGDIGMMVSNPWQTTKGWFTGIGHGWAMVGNMATLHQIDSLNNYVNNTVAQNGGAYGTANVFAHVGVISAYAAGGAALWAWAGLSTAIPAAASSAWAGLTSIPGAIAAEWAALGQMTWSFGGLALVGGGTIPAVTITGQGLFLAGLGIAVTPGILYSVGGGGNTWQNQVEALEEQIANLQEKIESILDEEWGYGKHRVDGSMEYLQQLMQELAELLAKKPAS